MSSTVEKRKPEIGDTVKIIYKDNEFITKITRIDNLSLILKDQNSGIITSLTWKNGEWLFPDNSKPVKVKFILDSIPIIKNEPQKSESKKYKIKEMVTFVVRGKPFTYDIVNEKIINENNKIYELCNYETGQCTTLTKKGDKWLLPGNIEPDKRFRNGPGGTIYPYPSVVFLVGSEKDSILVGDFVEYKVNGEKFVMKITDMNKGVYTLCNNDICTTLRLWHDDWILSNGVRPDKNSVIFKKKENIIEEKVPAVHNAAFVLPFDGVYVYLGRETKGKDKGTFDAFGGKREEKDQNKPIHTAAREFSEEGFTEETLGMNEYQLQNHLKNATEFTVIDEYNGQIVKNVLFISQFSPEQLKKFVRNYSIAYATNSESEGTHEKDALAWIKVSDLLDAIRKEKNNKEVYVDATVKPLGKPTVESRIHIRPVLVKLLRGYAEGKDYIDLNGMRLYKNY